MKRIAFFVHYDRHNIVDDYVIHYLRKLKPHCSEIIVISHSALCTAEQNKFSEITNTTLLKLNKGFDFSAWKFGLTHYGPQNLANFDEVLLVNDSCYGPIVSFDRLFSSMEKQDCDFWGITDNGFQGGENLYSVSFTKLFHSI